MKTKDYYHHYLVPTRNSHTDGTEETFITRDRLAMVALSPFKRLCEVDGALVLLAGKVELVDAALRDHCSGFYM
jgi:hypothetical protein